MALSGTTFKAKAMKTAVSVNQCGFGSGTAAKSLAFSGQIVHCHLARQRARVRWLLRRYWKRKSWRAFHLKIETLLISAFWPPAFFHTTAARAFCGASQYLRILIQDWRQEYIMPSLTSTRLMSLVSTLENLCMHCSKLEQLASEGNKYNFSSGCIAYDIGAHEF